MILLLTILAKMESVPITFTHKGKLYSGYFHAVQGAGSSQVWHLMINDYYYGRLRYTDKWVFDSQIMPEMAEEFGSYITGWFQ
jgi:hypothetical protein